MARKRCQSARRAEAREGGSFSVRVPPDTSAFQPGGGEVEGFDDRGGGDAGLDEGGGGADDGDADHCIGRGAVGGAG